MTEGSQGQSFWTTVPGILTGIAAVITAVTGLVIGLSQGSSHSSARPSSAPPAAAEPSRPAGTRSAPASTSPPDAPASTSASNSRTEAPKAEAMVVVTAQDGRVTRVFADSFQHAQTGRELALLSGQTIAFDRIKVIEVTRLLSDHANVTITLVDGSTHSGAIPAGLSPFAFTGANDLGNFEIRVDKLAKVSFER